MAARRDIKPERGDVTALQDHLIAAVQSGNLIEQNYPVVQKIRAVVILNEKQREKLSCRSGTQADVAWRRELYFAAKAIAGGAFFRYKRKAAVFAPEQLALAGREGLAGIMHGPA